MKKLLIIFTLLIGFTMQAQIPVFHEEGILLPQFETAPSVEYNGQLYFQPSTMTVFITRNMVWEPLLPAEVDESKWEISNSTINNVGVGDLRVPTETEWDDERLSWGTNNAAGAFNSPLKLAVAGYRYYSNGSLFFAGESGYYWSSTVSYALSRYLAFNSSAAVIYTNLRAYGRTVRLILDGAFTQQEFEDNYLGQTIVIKGLTYGYVYNPTTSRIWLDRNLGATQVATSSTDADAYGWLYQWGRLTDGHQIRTSGTTATLSSTDVPFTSDFIGTPASSLDWRSPQNDNLWNVGQKLIGKDSLKADYEDLLNKPTISTITTTSQLTNDGEDGVNPYITANDVNAIPLTGTEVGSPVTGNLTSEQKIIFKDLDDNYNVFIGYDSDTDFTGLLRSDNNDISYFSPSFNPTMGKISADGENRLLIEETRVQINGTVPGFKGIEGGIYYGANYTDNTYVQKKYVDDTRNIGVVSLTPSFLGSDVTIDLSTFDFYSTSQIGDATITGVLNAPMNGEVVIKHGTIAAHPAANDLKFPENWIVFGNQDRNNIITPFKLIAVGYPDGPTFFWFWEGGGKITYPALHYEDVGGILKLKLSTFNSAELRLIADTVIEVNETPGVNETFTRTLGISSTVAETLTLPVEWNVYGTYVADSTRNKLSIEFTNTTEGGLVVDCFINQPN